MHQLKKFCAYGNCNVETEKISACKNNCDPDMVDAGIPSCKEHGKLLGAAAEQDEELSRRLDTLNDFLLEHKAAGCPTENHAAIKNLVGECQERLLQTRVAAYNNRHNNRKATPAAISSDPKTDAAVPLERAASLRGRNTSAGRALGQAAFDIRNNTKPLDEVLSSLPPEAPKGAVTLLGMTSRVGARKSC